MSYEQFVKEAGALGSEHGHARGAWVIDGNTPDETKREIIQGYEDGDPDVLDIAPWPLSGQHGDER